MSALNWVYLRLACTCEETCLSVWPPNASLYGSSTCRYLRLLASPFGQGFTAARKNMKRKLKVAREKRTEKKERTKFRTGNHKNKQSSKYGTWQCERVILQFMCVGSWAGVTCLRYTVLTSSNKDETAVHCRLRSCFIGSCLVGVSKRLSRNISLAVRCLSLYISGFGWLDLLKILRWQCLSLRLLYEAPYSFWFLSCKKISASAHASK